MGTYDAPAFLDTFQVSAFGRIYIMIGNGVADMFKIFNQCSGIAQADDYSADGYIDRLEGIENQRQYDIPACNRNGVIKCED